MFIIVYIRSVKVVMWLNQNFLLQDDIVIASPLDVKFVSLRGSGPLFIRMEQSGQVMKWYSTTSINGNSVYDIYLN